MFLLIHTGVPVRVASAETLSLLSAHRASNICYRFPGAVANALDLKDDPRHVFHGDGRISQYLQEAKKKQNQKSLKEAKAGHEGRGSPWRNVAAFA